MGDQINIEQTTLNDIVTLYKNDMGKKKELELIYNGNINEKSLKKIISFLNKKTKNKTIKNILDSKLIDDKRLTIEGTDNILNKHCNFEAENMESNITSNL